MAVSDKAKAMLDRQAKAVKTKLAQKRQTKAANLEALKTTLSIVEIEDRRSRGVLLLDESRYSYRLCDASRKAVYEAIPKVKLASESFQVQDRLGKTVCTVKHELGGTKVVFPGQEEFAFKREGNWLTCDPFGPLSYGEKGIVWQNETPIGQISKNEMRLEDPKWALPCFVFFLASTPIRSVHNSGGGGDESE